MLHVKATRLLALRLQHEVAEETRRRPQVEGATREQAREARVAPSLPQRGVQGGLGIERPSNPPEIEACGRQY